MLQLNIVPNSTGAAKLSVSYSWIGRKIAGSAQRVPVATGSSTILQAVVNKSVTVEEVNAAMKAAANDSYGYTEDEIVSSDIIGVEYGSLFDATQTAVMPLEDGKTLVKVVSWYDNETHTQAKWLKQSNTLQS